MKVRALDKNHDWTLRHNTESKAIAQNVKTNVLFLYNNWFLEQDLGIKWFEYLRKNPNIEKFEQDIKNAVLKTNGVVTLDGLNINLENRKATITITYTDLYKKTNEVDVYADN